MTVDPHLSSASDMVVAACRRAGFAPDPQTLGRVAALVAQAVADGEILTAVDVSADDAPAADRPQDVLP